ncbi:MAG TPA: hypothetical protein VEW66_03360, partial [Thermomicrobiales bacterium]|nr:hypothetical protein [Thermomicrobiales bacterium]
PAAVEMYEGSSELLGSAVTTFQASTSRVSRRRILLGTCGIAGIAVGLTACSTGSSREAERGRERDAERTSVVDRMQATRTASLIIGTPPATPSDP